jgi:hypothetical protein
MKKAVLIYDYVDPNLAVLGKMDKRPVVCYKSIGYEIKE